MIPSDIRSDPPPRPSTRELYRKINEAKRLLQAGRWRPVNVLKMQANWEEIEQTFPTIDTSLREDQEKILATVLNEISPEHYVGGHPPEPSYEPVVSGQDMWEFRWTSAFFGNRTMYLKFCFSKGDEISRRLYMMSLHQNRDLKNVR